MILRQIKRYYLRKVQKLRADQLKFDQEHTSASETLRVKCFEAESAEEDAKKQKELLKELVQKFEEISDSRELNVFFTASWDGDYRRDYTPDELEKRVLLMSPKFKSVLTRIEGVRDDERRARERERSTKEEAQKWNKKFDRAKEDLRLAIKGFKTENVELRLLLRTATKLENVDNLVAETQLQLETLDQEVLQIEDMS